MWRLLENLRIKKAKLLKFDKKIQKKALILIPARGGSSRVKNKNIRIVKNKPLIYWTILFAKKNSKGCDIVVSSDSNKIKRICFENKVNFLNRPLKFSSNSAPMSDVINHALKHYEYKNKIYKYVILLQPTSPIREKNLIREGLELLDKKKNFNVLYHLYNSKEFTGKLKKNSEFIPDYHINKRSQDISGKYIPTGNLFIYRASNFYQKKLVKKKYLGLVSKSTLWVNIDYEKDFCLLDGLIKKFPNLLKY